MDKNARRTKAKRAKRVKAESVELSSGNVFADLGFEDADERMLKAQLAIGIDQLDRGEYVEYASVEEMFEDIEAAVPKRR
ncbi:MAG TPA: hypothetical protein VN937_06290 [Blastocatellia bacterium]|nr:hypothetical protein [Blastocatellia bacterium]